MHFHLPKPLHGWREFLGEVGIIVIGVLIALGAEQLVESLHWHEQVAAERASLMQEATDMHGAFGRRTEQRICVDRRLSEIRTILKRRARGEPLGIVGKVGAPVHPSASTGTWQIALAGQALAHMSYAEKLSFSGAFGDSALWEKAIENERAPWLGLGLLDNPDLLDANDWAALKRDYAAAVAENEHMRLLAPWLQRENERLLPEIARMRSVDNVAEFKAFNDTICKPLLSTKR